MYFIETRGNDGHHPSRLSFSQAILSPLASFGGLFAPDGLPVLGEAFLRKHLESGYQALARDLLKAFDLDLESALIDEALRCYASFDNPQNPAPVVKIGDDLFVSELYHGPTRAFKDMALQPFGVVLSALARQRDERYLILAATSGDTGPATLEAFKGRANVKVACLYPHGGTSDVQRLQMVTEDAPNLKVIGIRGDFDDAQTALKHLLGSTAFKARLREKQMHLSAANSVNFGRIAFQIIYHFHSYLELVRQGAIPLGGKAYLDVPSGNFGNALGAYYAMKMGLPIEKILIASNRNHVLADLIETGRYDIRQRTLVPTSAPAMDILKSSNIERVLFDLFGAERTRELMRQLDERNYYALTPEELARLQEIFGADWCDDETALAYIRKAYENGYLMDTHTATCFKPYESRREKALPTIIYSTAEWTKFSPTLARALFNEAGLSDEKALRLIAVRAGVSVPERIQALFEKPVAQPLVIEKTDIEQAVLEFI